MPPPTKANAGSNRSARGCPNCRSVVPPGSIKCPKCGLEVAKMAGFLAAMRAAEKKGVARTVIEKEKAPVAVVERGEDTPGGAARMIKLAAVVLALVIVVGGIYWYMTRPKVPFWTKYPPTREAATEELLKHIATGDDNEYDKAYALIPPEARDKEDGDERGHYRGLFHAVYLYLSGEFGPGWETTAKLTPDTKDPDVMDVAIGPETLHVRLAQETPADQLATAHEHYAVVGIDEFNIQEAAGFQSDAARMGVVGGLAGQGAVNNLQTVLGASGRAHERPMQKKLRLLPILRNPRQTVWRTVIEVYPLRNDPVVRNRLTLITEDDRYDKMIQQKAKEVLDDRVSDEDKIAVGVD